MGRCSRVKHDPTWQALAALRAGRPIVARAGAGCAKTTLLTKVAVALSGAGVDVGAILMLAFGRLAAGEMTARVEAGWAKAGVRWRRKGEPEWSASTFHSWCNRLLRECGGDLGIDPNFVVLGTSDATDVVRDLLRDLRPRGHRDGRQNRVTAATVYGVISKRVNTGRHPRDLRAEVGLQDHGRLVRRVYEGYRDYKAEHGYLDLDDLLVQAARLLRVSPDARQFVADTYKYVLVDEAQDLNRYQVEIVFELIKAVGRAVVCIDPDQAIFQWRGASANVLERFEHEFPKAVQVPLETNFRSTQQILDLANGVAGRQLRSGCSGGPVPELVRFRSDYAEARWVADLAKKVANDSADSDVSRLAILYRVGEHADCLKMLLESRKVPFRYIGGTETRLTSLAHARDVLAHLRVLANPSDDIALRRVLRLCHRIDARAATIAKKLGGKPVAPALTEYAGDNKRALGNAGEGLRGLARLLDQIDDDDLKPAARVAMVRDYYLALPKVRCRLKKEDPEAVQSDLERLVTIAGLHKRVDRMLWDLAANPPLLDEGAAAGATAPVVLSTIHGFKGLQADEVILLGARDGQIPYAHQGQEPSGDALAEERRLLYVAVTRARDRLTITYHGKEGDFSRYFLDLAHALCRSSARE